MKTLEKLRISYVGFFHETNTYLTEGDVIPGFSSSSI